MRIQVDCGPRGDPRAFHLGARRLHVMRVLERTAEDAQRRFRVRIADGREFVLRHDLDSGAWQLARVHRRT
jgi:hypothetical protein